MAVYTVVPSEALDDFIKSYDVGTVRSFKGIAEGVSNSNFMIETNQAHFILTLYEHRINFAELPFFISLMEYLADAHLPVPRPIRDRHGEALKMLEGRHACLIEFLPGVSVSHPTVDQTQAVGRALANLHLAAQSFPQKRSNSLGPDWWRQISAQLESELDSIAPGLQKTVAAAVARLDQWPDDLPKGIIHADLFPDNVLMIDSKVTGLIDFYFACTDYFIYDLAVLHAAWAFLPDGSAPLSGHQEALFAGYQSVRPLSNAEKQAFPLMAQGAALRFLLSRAQDWLAPHADNALVQRKDPLPFVRRLNHYASHGAALV